MSQKQSFEKQMERLQAVVAELEKGDLPLEKSVALYKEGQTLVNACKQQLENARQAVKLQGESGLSDFAEAQED